jgi:hypothetical protein
MATSEQQDLTLDRRTTYQIIVPVELDESWTDWDGQMSLEVVPSDEGPPVTVISGQLDQAALHGLLRRVYALGLPIQSVNRVGTDGEVQRVQHLQAE